MFNIWQGHGLIIPFQVQHFLCCSCLIILSVNIRIMSEKNLIGIFIESILSIQINLKNTDIFAIEFNIQIFLYISQLHFVILIIWILHILIKAIPKHLIGVLNVIIANFAIIIWFFFTVFSNLIVFLYRTVLAFVYLLCN